jgi:hypothetical protein
MVIAAGLANSQKMVVQAVEIEAKTVTSVWFSYDHRGRVGVLPASSLDRFEAPSVPAEKVGTTVAGKKK